MMNGDDEEEFEKAINAPLEQIVLVAKYTPKPNQEMIDRIAATVKERATWSSIHLYLDPEEKKHLYNAVALIASTGKFVVDPTDPSIPAFCRLVVKMVRAGFVE